MLYTPRSATSFKVHRKTNWFVFLSHDGPARPKHEDRRQASATGIRGCQCGTPQREFHNYQPETAAEGQLLFLRCRRSQTSSTSAVNSTWSVSSSATAERQGRQEKCESCTCCRCLRGQPQRSTSEDQGKAATKSAHAQDSTRAVVVFGFHLDPTREVFEVHAFNRQHAHQQAASPRLQGGYLGRLQYQRVGQRNLFR
jgi:hypothetical protein